MQHFNNLSSSKTSTVPIYFHTNYSDTFFFVVIFNKSLNTLDSGCYFVKKKIEYIKQ